MERMKNRLKPEFLKKWVFVAILILLLCAGVLCPGVYATQDEKHSLTGLDTTEALIELLKLKGVINEEEARSFLERQKLKIKASQQIVTLVPQENQEEVLQKVSKEVAKKVTKEINEVRKDAEYSNQYLARRASLLEQELEQLHDTVDKEASLRKNSWAQRIRFGGDIRLRQESVLFNKENAIDIEDPNTPGSLINSTSDEHKQRVRLRLGMTAKLLEPQFIEGQLHNVGTVEAGLRLATGSVGNPVSTNKTLGDDSDSRSDIVLDRAYIKYSYNPLEAVWGGKIPEFSATGGIMKNPWFNPTNLIWDSDLAFEGFVVGLKTDTLKVNPFKGFLTLGYFPLQESEWSQDDKYLLGAQIGFQHRPAYGWEYKIAASYYDYYNVEGKPIDSVTLTTDELRQLSHMSPKFMQKGNSTFDMSTSDSGNNNVTYGLLSDFELLNITGTLTNTHFWPVYVTFYWDWVKNLGYDSDSMSEKAGVSKQYMEGISGDVGYQLGLKVGFPKPRNRWEWNVFAEYRYLESDAVLDAYTDSDFHLGGTNAKGFIFGGELGLYKNVWLKARWMSANEIEDMQMFGDTQEDDLSVDTFQLDLNAEF